MDKPNMNFYSNNINVHGMNFLKSFHTGIIFFIHHESETIRGKNENNQKHGRHRSLSDAQNNVLEDGQEPIVYLHGGYDDTLPALEKALDGKDVGYKTMIQVEPEEAFGEYDPLLVRVEDRESFPTPLEVGMQFEGMPENADPTENPAIYVVTDIADGKVILDGNHPLAGIALRFELTVTDVRAATEKEIERGYVNDPDGFDDDEDGQFRSIVLH